MGLPADFAIMTEAEQIQVLQQVDMWGWPSMSAIKAKIATYKAKIAAKAAAVKAKAIAWRNNYNNSTALTPYS